MPPTFQADQFKFEDGQTIPDHIEGEPSLATLDPAKFWLEAVSVSDCELYPLAIDVDDMPTATMLKAARLRHLEEVRTVETSGGEKPADFEDLVFIRKPERPEIRIQSKHKPYAADELTEIFGRDPGSFLKTTEVARILGISNRAVTDAAAKGNLPHIRTPGDKHFRFTVSDIKKVYEDQRKS